MSVAFLGLWRTSFWGPFEPRVLAIAREQYAAGDLLRVPTFSGMPFLEKPALYYDLLAIAFHVAGGPSVTAARLVHGLLLVVWVIAAMLAVRRAAGPRAAVLAACLVATANLFVKLAGRISIDALLAASLTLSLACFARALSSGRGRIPSSPWLMGLAFGGVAFLTKGFLGTFLFGAPLLAFAAWTRDRRIVAALLRPVSLLVLVVPIALWAAILYADGGATFVFEAFVNNTLGRFLNHRFMAAGVQSLEYGDVNSPAEPWHYLRRIVSLSGVSIVAVPFVVRQLWARRRRATGPRTRLTALALCFALVPPIVLSFSSQKGVHHLGSCTSGFAIAGALWFDRHAVRVDAHRPPAWLFRACAALAWSASVLLVLSLLGLPPTRATAIGLGAAGAAAGLALTVVSARNKSRRLAAHCLLSTLAIAAVVSRSPGGTDPEDTRFTAFAEWLHDELGPREVGLFGHGDSDLGAFCWSMRAQHDSLRTLDEVEAYMSSGKPRYCVVREPAPERVLARVPGVHVVAAGGNGSREYVLFANQAAAASHVPSGRPAPR